jgi:exodeoxyribonuclease VII large subunit
VTLPLFEAGPAAGAPRVVSLVRLSGEIARSLVAIGRVAVEGEVYRPTNGRTGGIYFTLRDRVAQISVRVPAPAARRSRVVAGERVSVVGSLQWSNDRGQVQLVAEEVLPVGAGAIAALIEQTRARLSAAGLLDRPRRPLPVLPAVVGVVCGTEAAVRQDIESVVAARCPGYPVRFCETTVTGPAASVSIVEAIETLAGEPGVEVIILARGGGDAPSLLPWSTEDVCRAVASCPVPVVSAIGHEGDRPLCDEAADHREGTPSLAATAVLPDLAALAGRLDTLRTGAAGGWARRLEEAGRRLLDVDPRRSVALGVERAEQRLARVSIRLAGLHPGPLITSASHRLSAAEFRRPMWEALGQADGRWRAEGRHLAALSPLRTLDRGYAVVRGPDGAVLRSPAGLRPGDRITARLARGQLVAAVQSVSLQGEPG